MITQVSIKYPLHVADRLQTLNSFKSKMNDPLRSKNYRATLYVAYKKVLAEVNDTKLMEMRRRLILAMKAGDERAEWKIGNQIKSYLNQPLFTNPNWHR